MPMAVLTGSILGWIGVQVGFAQPDPDPTANHNPNANLKPAPNANTDPEAVKQFLPMEKCL